MTEMLTVVTVCLALIVFALSVIHANYKREAFDRGFMVQCIGKTGYYWECE